MQNLWSDGDAKSAIAHHAAKGIGEDLALRVYTTRLLGGEPRLVLHGGGNTSVKTRMADVTGEPVEVLCVKGSGWDMGTIEAPGLPAVRLAPLGSLLGLQALSDEDMVNIQRCNLLDSKAPNPSVETLLHAFLPHKFIDHTHSNAVLALTDQPDGAALTRDVFGRRAGLAPYLTAGVARKSRGRGAGPAEARHLLDGRHGRRGLCAHDRSGDLGGEASRQSHAQDLSRRQPAQGDRDGGRDRADPARTRFVAGKVGRPRGCAALRVRVPQRAGDPGLCRRQGDRPL